MPPAQPICFAGVAANAPQPGMGCTPSPTGASAPSFRGRPRAGLKRGGTAAAPMGSRMCHMLTLGMLNACDAH